MKDFDPTQYVDKQTARRMDRFLHFAAAAAQEALADAAFDMDRHDPRRVGVVVGSGIGGVHTLLEQQKVLEEKGPAARQSLRCPRPDVEQRGCAYQHHVRRAWA